MTFSFTISDDIMKLLCLVFIGLTPIGGYAQNPTNRAVNLVCTYSLTYQPDSTTSNSLTERMQLNVAEDFSEFRSTNRFTRDSLLNKLVASPAGAGAGGNLVSSLGQVMSVKPAKFTYIVYKFKGSARCVVHDEIIGKTYQYPESDYPMTWDVTPIKATISGYLCQKALTSFAGRHYEAWFTTTVPVADGPYKFGGLPGLIVKVGDTKGHYVFELLSLQRPSQPYFILPLKEAALLTTKRDFMRGARAARENLVDRAGQRGITFAQPEEVQRMMQEKLRRANNPLEIKP